MQANLTKSHPELPTCTLSDPILSNSLIRHKIQSEMGLDYSLLAEDGERDIRYLHDEVLLVREEWDTNRIQKSQKRAKTTKWRKS